MSDASFTKNKSPAVIIFSLYKLTVGFTNAPEKIIAGRKNKLTNLLTASFTKRNPEYMTRYDGIRLSFLLVKLGHVAAIASGDCYFPERCGYFLAIRTSAKKFNSKRRKYYAYALGPNVTRDVSWRTMERLAGS